MPTTARTSLRIAATAALGGALLLGSTGAAQASHGGGDRGRVQATGDCSARADWKLKAKADDGRVEVEYEVDANRAGQTWSVRITDNGTTVVSANAVTRGPSGSFSIERKVANLAGDDTFLAVATNARSGETCTGSVVFTR